MDEDWAGGNKVVSEFDHTGDRGIEVRADTLSDLFEAAAEGMFGLLFDQLPVESNRTLEVDVEASDPEDLMLKWLDELNFLHLTEGLAFSKFDVRKVSRKSLHAAAHGVPIEPGRPAIQTEIKAVTYHDLVVERRNDGGWFARIIFDI